MLKSSKPKHLTSQNAARFQQHSLVDVYQHRLPYPPETFDILQSLITDAPRNILDVGTGTGEIARQMVQRAEVDRVDAVDNVSYG